MYLNMFFFISKFDQLPTLKPRIKKSQMKKKPPGKLLNLWIQRSYLCLAKILKNSLDFFFQFNNLQLS